MKVLVTGGTGFLGTALCTRLRQQGHEAVPLNSSNCDLRRADSLQAFSQVSFDQIYHLAAWTQAGDFCIRHPGEQWIINQQINTNLLAWWQRCQPQAKFICTGTSGAYGRDLELVEENYLLGLPVDSLFAYAMTKRMLYVGLLALQKQFGLKFLCVVPSTLYGPGYHTDGRPMHFIFDLIRKILRGKLYGEPVVLWGDGYQTREIVYVEDLAALTLQLAGTCENDLINIGAGRELSMRDYARLICEQVGYDPSLIQFDISRPVDTRSRCLSIRKLLRLVPALELTPVQTGLARTIEWFQLKHPTVLAKDPP
jgi:GDP-L-fucose synthase